MTQQLSAAWMHEAACVADGQAASRLQWLACYQHRHTINATMNTEQLQLEVMRVAWQLLACDRFCRRRDWPDELKRPVFNVLQHWP
jgi:hypothetical protein